MNQFFEKQERERNLREEELRRKQDLGEWQRIKSDIKKENAQKIPYKDEYTRNELQDTLKEYYLKKCTDNIRICEASLGKKLGESKWKADREDKMRQLLWETSPELRELRKLLLMADVTRDQAMQVAEKQAMAELKRQEEESLAVVVEEEKRKYEEELKRKEQLEFQAKLKYHKDLDDLREFKASKDDSSEEMLKREKEAIDEIKRKIDEEDREIARRKIKAQKEYHRQAVELQKVRESMQMLEMQKDKTAELKVDEYRKAQELRAKQQEEKKQLDVEHRLQLQEELLSYLENMYAEKAKQDLLRTELSIEEREAQEKERAAEDETRQQMDKEQLQQIYDMQMYVKKQQEELGKKEEELFRENLLSQLYEEEKLEYMSRQKRRLKQAEHRRIAQELIEQNREKKESERAEEKAAFEMLKDREAQRTRRVEEERKKFLGEHAKELLGYLPKRMFRDKEEIERLGDEFKKFYSRRNCSRIFQTEE